MAPRRKRQKRWLKWLAFLLLVGLAALVVYLVWESYFKETPKTVEEKKTEETVVVDTEIPIEEKQKEVESQEVTEKKEVVQYEGENPNELSELTGVVTYAGVSGDKLLIRVNIDQYLTSGSCELALLDAGVSIYSDTAEIVDAATTATCAGFNVPLSEVGGRDLEIVVYLAADGKAGEIRGEVKL